MATLRFALVALNAVAFVVLFVTALHFRRLGNSTQARRLWGIVALISAALVIGSSQRLALQAGAAGWISDSTVIDVIDRWQFVQSVGVAALVLAVFVAIRRLAQTMAASEAIAGSLLERVAHVDPSTLKLTAREREVLMAIGRGHVTDAELSDVLHISASTVQTHVKSLLRKTGLNRRQDLIAVAGLLDQPQN